MSKLYERKDDGTYVEAEGFVPRHRLNEVAAERDKLQADLEQTTTALEQSRTAAAKSLESAQGIEAQIEALKSRHGEDLAMVRAGIDDEAGMKFVRVIHDSLPEGERPPVQDLIDAWKQDPTQAPRPMRAYFEQPKPDQAPAPEGGEGNAEGAGEPAPANGAPPTPRANGLPRPDNRVAPPRPSGTAAKYTPEQIRSMSPSQIKEHLDAITADIRRDHQG